MEDRTYIKLFRKMLKWEWYTDTNTKVVFLHCLLKANFEEKEWRGMLIERGQFEATVSSIAGEINLTPGTMYGSLSKMEKDGLIEFRREEDKRRLYEITDLGREVLGLELKRIKRLYKNALEAEEK